MLLLNKSIFTLTSFDLSVASESSLRHRSVDGIILTGHTRHSLLQHGNVAVTTESAVAITISTVESTVAVAIHATVSINRRASINSGIVSIERSVVLVVSWDVGIGEITITVGGRDAVSAEWRHCGGVLLPAAPRESAAEPVVASVAQAAALSAVAVEAVGKHASDGEGFFIRLGGGGGKGEGKGESGGILGEVIRILSTMFNNNM